MIFPTSHFSILKFTLWNSANHNANCTTATIQGTFMMSLTDWFGSSPRASNASVSPVINPIENRYYNNFSMGFSNFGFFGCVFLWFFDGFEIFGKLWFFQFLIFEILKTLLRFKFLKTNEPWSNLANFNFLETVFKILNPKTHHFIF